MPTTYQASFAAGILSPRLRGRIDLAQYAAGAEDLTNMVVLLGGGATRRQGSYRVAAPKPGGRVRLVPWRIASDVTYLLEFGASYIRFFRDRGQLTNSAAAVLEVATPYTLDQLRELSFTASADVLYILHGSHQPRKLSRTASDTFSLALVAFADGPYDTENTGNTGAASPAPTVTAPEGGTIVPDAGAGSGAIWGGDATGGEAEGGSAGGEG